MPTVKLYNDNIYPYKETLDDEVIEIPARGFKIMDRDQAHRLVCRISPVITDAGGTPIKKTIKKLRMVMLSSADDARTVKDKIAERTCQACTEVFNSMKELEEHIELYHADDLVDKKEREKRQKNRDEKNK